MFAVGDQRFSAEQKALSRIFTDAATIQLALGIAGVSPALVGVPPTRSSAQAIGETPMAATETVALPFS